MFSRPAVAILLLFGVVMSIQLGNATARVLEQDLQASGLLQNLQKGPVRPPGNGCTEIPKQNGPPCISSRNFAGHTAPSPPNAYPTHLFRFGIVAEKDVAHH